jgi:hypothetical protein
LVLPASSYVKKAIGQMHDIIYDAALSDSAIQNFNILGKVAVLCLLCRRHANFPVCENTSDVKERSQAKRKRIGMLYLFLQLSDFYILYW